MITTLTLENPTLARAVYACKVPGGFVRTRDGQKETTRFAYEADMFSTSEEAHAALASYVNLMDSKHWGTAWTFKTSIAALYRFGNV